MTRKQRTGIALAVVALLATGAALASHRWWSLQDGRWTLTFGIQSLRQCRQGDRCEKIDYVASVGRMRDTLSKARSTDEGWLIARDSAAVDNFEKAKDRLDNFGSLGFGAALAAGAAMLGLAVAATLAALRRASGARAAAMLGGGAALLALGLGCAFYFGQSIGEIWGKGELKAGLGFPLFAIGTVLALAAAVLLARGPAAWEQALAEE